MLEFGFFRNDSSHFGSKIMIGFKLKPSSEVFSEPIFSEQILSKLHVLKQSIHKIKNASLPVVDNNKVLA